MTGDRIETAEERDALPVTTVIRDAQGAVFERFAEGFWVATGEEIGGVPEVPAIVLYRPDAPRPAAFTDSSCEHCPDVDALAKFLTGRAIPGGSGPDVILSPNQADHLARSLSMEFSSRAPVADLRTDIEARDETIEQLREEIRARRSFMRDHAIAHHGAAPWTDDERAAGLVPPFEHECGLMCRNPDADRIRTILADVEALAASNGAWKGAKHFRVTQRTDCGEVTRSAVWVDDLRAILATHPTVESAGVAMIADERRRQVEVEGYTAEHDDGHESALARAAACYAMPIRTALLPHEYGAPSAWPWTREFWKPTPGDRVRELVKAGALIAAAIDAHLTRQEASDGAR